ncbi:hypothetical protein SLEP1_g32417 [Rubroshorea leprosula]|uniref:Uncharacterized protein n=1 Tax=Rubroshorea leprosula TaxID=152421 RepID=A0AAV5KD94_9ROSI|nr:hypothetical protein SLEP1_g32417 [Rubroshorea leprosula]
MTKKGLSIAADILRQLNHQIENTKFRHEESKPVFLLEEMGRLEKNLAVAKCEICSFLGEGVW